MRSWLFLFTFALVGIAAACGGADEAEEAPADTAAQDDVIFVPDSTIESEVRTRIDADPRFDRDGVDIEVHAKDGNVSLVGTVPTRMEWSIAREVALSAPGVRRVLLDSLEVLSDPRREEEEPTTAT